MVFSLSAQVKSDLVQSRVLILLDESSSMIQPWVGQKEKYKAAKDIVLRIMDSVYAFNNDVEFSLRVFGHQHTVQENNCYDTKNEVAFTKSNRTQMELRLADIRPLGVTPIAYALRQAAENDLVDELRYAYSIILITDGGESCGGDLCEVMRKLIAAKVFFKPYIVGLEDAPELRSAYACMGNFLSVTKEEEMPTAVSTIVEAFRPIIKITKSDFKQLQILGANAPSILKVNIPPIKNPSTTEKPKESVTLLQPTLPEVVKINHLAIAPTISFDIAKNQPEVITTVHIPPAPAPEIEKIALPKVSKIDHIAPASTIELAGYTMHSSPLKTITPPAITNIVLETIDQPVITKIAHINTSPISLIEVIKPEPVHLKLVTLPNVDEPAVLPKPVSIAHIKPAGLKLAESPMASIVPLKLVKSNIAAIAELEIPSIPTTGKIAHINPSKLRIAASPTIPMTPLVLVNATAPSVDYKDIPTKQVTDKIFRIKPARIKEPRVIFIIEDHVLALRTPPPGPTFAPPPPPPPPLTKVTTTSVSSTKPSFAAPGVKPGITSGYTVEALEAKETSVMVYFTNGHGKFYTSTPQVVLVEPYTNKIIKKFYRTVDPAGVPDPQKDVPTGTFNIAISDKRNLVLHDVEIAPNKLNKIIVKLKNCSLTFEYEGAPTRPVSEFIATVIQRNEANGKVTNQKCTQKLEYEPGNYHLVIHSYPEDIRNVDLDFDDTKVITLAQPGYVKFTTTMKNRKLNFFKPVNDRFLQFDTKNSGDTILHRLQIQPGQYQVRYLKDPTKPYSKETIIPFAIKSNDTTFVELPGN